MAAFWPCVLTVRTPHGEPIVLRGLRTQDRGEWEALRAANSAWLAPWEATTPDNTPRPTFRRLVRHYDSEAHAGRMQPFVIERQGRLVGQMHLFGITWGAMRGGSAGYWVARSEAGHGVAPLALAALVDHAVFAIGLHRVEVNIRPENAASLRVVEKLGFRAEGLREKYLFIDGQWRDHLTFALTAEDLSDGSLLARWNTARA